MWVKSAAKMAVLTAVWMGIQRVDTTVDCLAVLTVAWWGCAKVGSLVDGLVENRVGV